MSDTSAPPLTLVEFLTARLDEWEPEVQDEFYYGYLEIRERVLADIAAKRRVLEFWEIWNAPDTSATWNQPAGGPAPRDDAWARATRHAIDVVLRQLASVYRDHPQWREEWA